MVVAKQEREKLMKKVTMRIKKIITRNKPPINFGLR
jgi:hypothetical protein